MRPLAYLLIASGILHLIWIFAIPMVKAPDEFAHHWMIDFMVSHARLPYAAEVSAGGASAVYGSMPAMGYLPHVAWGWLSRLGESSVSSQIMDFTRWIRLGSVVCGLITIACAHYLGQKLFPPPNHLLIRWALPLAVALHPQFLYVTSYANNDATTACLSAIIAVLIYKILEAGITASRSLCLGLATGFLLLSKFSGYCILPAIAMVFVLLYIRESKARLKIATHAILVAAIAGSTSIWCFLRNGDVFDGDFLGTRTMVAHWAEIYHRDPTATQSLSHVLKEKTWWQFWFNSFYGCFGYLDMPLPTFLYQSFLSIIILSAGALGLRGWVKEKFWWYMGVATAINFAAMVYAQMQNLGGGQGRYLFPCEIFIFAWILRGLSGLPGKAALIATYALLAILLTGTACATVMLISSFGLSTARSY